VIATAKNIVASVSNIITWPLNILATNVTTANKRLIRWAVRKRVGAAYLLALFWFPALTVAGLLWVLVSIHQRPDALWPIATAVIFFVNKFMFLLLYVVKQYERSVRALRHYRRHFG